MYWPRYSLQSAYKENYYFTAKEDDPYSFTTMKMSGVKVKVCNDDKIHTHIILWTVEVFVIQ